MERNLQCFDGKMTDAHDFTLACHLYSFLLPLVSPSTSFSLEDEFLFVLTYASPTWTADE